jgi:ABC-2 type transport system ATP-binding protein
VKELTDRLGLDPQIRFGALSKGNRQKVGLVLAFMHDPDVLILDEPTTGLDPLVQREFLALTNEAAGRGAAVLFSSHVLPEVERIAAKVAIIQSGELVAFSTVDRLLARARRRLELHFADGVPEAALRDASGVSGINVDGNTATVTIDGPVGPALHAATETATLLRVGSVGDELEDLFVALFAPREAG